MVISLEQHVYMKIQNFCYFFFEVYFEIPKIYANQLNNISNGVAMKLQYLQLYQRDASLEVLFKICSDL